MSIGCCFGDLSRTYHATGTSLVVHDDGLFQCLGEMSGDCARQPVRHTSGRGRNDNSHGTIWKVGARLAMRQPHTAKQCCHRYRGEFDLIFKHDEQE
ncbi:hypothetical protein D3C87_1986930 [compost metagenome]